MASPTDQNGANAPNALDLLRHFSAVRDIGEKANAQRIAFMDRIVLLSGGALTLTFTTIGNIGTHVRGNNGFVRYIPFVIVACWLLVATILLGLAFNAAFIRLKVFLELGDLALAVRTEIKQNMLEFPGVNAEAVNNLSLLEAKPATKKKIAWLWWCTNLLEWAAQSTLVAAFICLAWFIQKNIWTMLGAAH